MPRYSNDSDSDESAYYPFYSLYGCNYCDKQYPDSGRLERHEARVHYVCPAYLCSKKHKTFAALLNHCRQTGCYDVCQGCCQSGMIFLSEEHYWDHVRDNNVCIKCERHFGSPSNLAHHKLTHRKPKYECLGCSRSFTTYGGMIIHLEAGTCPAQLDFVDIWRSAAMCYQWKKYMTDKFDRDLILQGEVHQEDRLMVFKCPTCDFRFSKLSSLFMHVESPSCDQKLDGGAMQKLRQWLMNRHG